MHGLEFSLTIKNNSTLLSFIIFPKNVTLQKNERKTNMEKILHYKLNVLFAHY